MTEIRLPQYGMGMTDGTITAWHKAVGDRLKKGELLCDIESAKTLVEMEAPESGVLRRIIVNADENVPVNTVIAEMDVEDSAEAPASRIEPTTTAQGAAASVAAIPVASGAAVQIEPNARRMAQELKLDLSKVVGTGPGGRITGADVQAFGSASKAATRSESAPAIAADLPVAPAEGAACTEIVNTMTRRTIAKRLTESKQQVPHFYVKASCEIDKLIALRARFNRDVSGKVSVNDLLVKAVALALRVAPDANVSWSEKAILQYHSVDVAVAVATPRGLVAPIVRGVDTKPLLQLAAELKDLIERAREGKLKPAEYQGGTVSMSNMGMLGVEEFSAIINPPQACIFAIGSADQRAVVRNGQVEIATVMTVTISVDHRAVDGAVAAKLLSAFKGLIESPEKILT